MLELFNRKAGADSVTVARIVSGGHRATNLSAWLPCLDLSSWPTIATPSDADPALTTFECHSLSATWKAFRCLPRTPGSIVRSNYFLPTAFLTRTNPRGREIVHEESRPVYFGAEFASGESLVFAMNATARGEISALPGFDESTYTLRWLQEQYSVHNKKLTMEKSLAESEAIPDVPSRHLPPRNQRDIYIYISPCRNLRTSSNSREPSSKISSQSSLDMKDKLKRVGFVL